MLAYFLMKKKLFFLYLIYSVGFGSISYSKDIKVGIMLGFTGPIDSLTPAMAASAELAFKEASASDELLGGLRIESIRGDSTCVDSSTAVKNAKKLIKQKVVAIMGADCSGVTGAIASKVTVPNGVVLISPSATSPRLTNLNDKGLFFRATPSDARGAEVLAQVTKEKGIGSVAITYTNNDYGKGMADNYRAALQKYGIIVTTSLAHEDGKGNYKEDVRKLSASGGNALAVFGYLDQGGRGIINQSLKSDAFDKFVLSDGMIGPSLTNKFGKKLNKSFGLIPGSTSIGGSLFSDFSKKNGIDSSGPYTGESYDAAALIVLAIQAGGSTDRASIAKNVMAVANGPGTKIYAGQLKKGLKLLLQGKQINYEGATNIEFTKVGESFGSFLVQDIKKGKFRTARTVSGVGLEQITVTTKTVKKTKPKKETTEKITKVVKKQEEFVPVFDKDETPPLLTIKENITVSSANYEITGKVSDEGSASDKIYVQVDGSLYPVNKGNFQIQRFSPVDEIVKIVAIDQWGNETKKTINVIVKVENKTIVRKLEPLNPLKIKAKFEKNKVALIIGIESYDKTSKALYANRDAKFFYEYAKKAFGIEDSNIKRLLDNDAGLVNTYSTIATWLPGKIEEDKTDLIIFYAGHGLASNDGKELYLLAKDSDANLLARTALSRTEIFDIIKKLKPKSTTIFFDACYTGFSRENETLLVSARPVRIVADDQKNIPDNFTIFSASKLQQISSGLKEAKHGIFSYYLMKGLEGKADINNDKKITNGELLAYMEKNVTRKASEQGRQQNPELLGDKEKIIIEFK